MRNGADVIDRTDDSLGEKEPQCELAVVAGRSHRDADDVSRDADLERLLDGDPIAARTLRLAAPDDRPGRNAVFGLGPHPAIVARSFAS
jgi:hypothetical protein